MFNLYLATILNYFISTNSVLVVSLGFSKYKILSSASRENLTSFLMWMLLTSFSCLIVLARSSSTMLNSSDESGHPCHVFDLRGKAFNFSPLSMMLAVGLWYMAFVCWGTFLLYLIYGELWIMKGYWILVNAFSASMKMTIWFLSFILLMQYITLTNLHMLNHPCIPGKNPTWSWCMIRLMCCWIGLLIFCWGFLHLCSLGILAEVFFSCSVLVWLWYQGNAGLVKWVWKYSLLFNFLQEFEKEWH